MAKAKSKKGSGGGVNSHIRARINFLHKAATYLQSAKTTTAATEDVAKAEEKITPEPAPMPSHANPAGYERNSQISRLFVSQMRGVSLKSQLRLPIDQKRSFCKRCDTLLLVGINSTQDIINPSRGSKKPWAEVRVVRCNACGTVKRFPQTDKRGRKLADRKKERKTETQTDSVKPT
ncbi:RNAse P Rpr2/Rpp21/SNM1 subunit domain-containing protein [Aspergillus karnatakaensis]|uniref:ribonuclease P Rpr2/Rpp21/SNM1 subunit n=1 Tax=Aspergillus karnatakaensis TaxID=1810916 RepID=UPI003CCCA02F